MLNELYKDLEDIRCASCKGCSILSSSASIKSHMDYTDLKQCNILFITDSFKSRAGMPVCLSPDEEKVIKSACKDRFVCSPAVKCSGVKESDMTPKNMNICRAHLSQTIEAVKPKIVFACGNLPLKMLLKKSGIKDKRGNIYEYVSDNGYKCLVMATLHPYMAVVEPKDRKSVV